MGITVIDRDYGNAVSIVRITTTNDLSTVRAANYILDQKINIEAANGGNFLWVPSDVVLVYASDGWELFTISSDFNSLNPFVSGTGVTLINTGTGLTGGPITTTGTISLAPIANDTFLANTSGISNAPSAHSFPLALSLGGTNANTSQSAYINLLAINPIAGATVLSDYGQTVVCTGSSDYSVTLPAVSSGKVIRFVFNTTSNALVTLTPASGTIQGQSSLKYGPNEGCTIYSDGTNWLVIEQNLFPVSFYAYINAGSQSISSGSQQIIHADTALYNVGSFYNTGTFTFQPLYPGKYEIHIGAFLASDGFTAGDEADVYFGTGSISVAQIVNRIQGAITQSYLQLHHVVSLNGSSEKVIPVVFLSSAATNIVLGGSLSNSYISGVRISNF